jgi:hypothetical protein
VEREGAVANKGRIDVEGQMMRILVRLLVAGGLCAATAVGLVIWLTGGIDWIRARAPSGRSESSRAPSETSNPDVTWYPDPNAPGTDARVCVDRRSLDVAMGLNAYKYKGPIKDTGSLGELREALRLRGVRRLAAKREEYDRLHFGAHPSFE